MAFLELHQLSKSYGSTSVVQELQLEVVQGEFISLLGPSGCGKTTTLQMVAGFVAPTGGRIRLSGRDITDVPAETRGMGVVFQSYALFPHMTVAQNVSFGLEMRGVPSTDRRTRINEALALVHLTSLGHRYPKELSGGQRQRVAIARALAVRPLLLLLDEPMSNLDAKLREEMHVELRAIQRNLGITTILITHDQVEAMTMSDRIAVMHGGRIVQLSTPQEAYERPTSAFASNFLGKTNVLRGTLGASRGDCRVVEFDEGQVLAIPRNDLPAEAVQLELHLRPEKIVLRPRSSSSLPGRTSVPGVVTSRMFLGTHWLVQVRCSLGMLQVTQFNVGETPAAVGTEVEAAWNDGDLRAFAEDMA